MSDITIAIIEDDDETRNGLSRLLARAPGCSLVGAFASVEEAVRALAGSAPDVILSDIGLPGMSGIEGVRLLKAAHPGTNVLMLTVYDDNTHVFEAICAGASGYLLKDTPPARLREAIREVQDGGAPMSPDIARKVVTMFRQAAPPRDAQASLSPRELELLRLLSGGHSYKTAADTLGIAMDTVRFHVRHIYEKLHVHSKSEAVMKAVRAGILR